MPAIPSGLPALWYQDADGNAVPDAIEQEIGYDPARDDCGVQRCAPAADGDELATAHNTLLVLDASGSMRAAAGGERKIDAARAALLRFVQYAPAKTTLGFLVYGHRGDNTPAGRPISCRGVELLAPIGTLRRESVARTLAAFEPTGWTPIAAALREAGAAFAGRAGQRNRVLLVSDGLETCGGDPVAVARGLHASDVALTIDVVGFDVSSTDAAQLRQVAQATGGSYADVRSRAELDAYLQRQTAVIVDNRERMLCEFRNSVSGATCASRLMLHLRNRVQRERATASPQQRDAYDALLERAAQLEVSAAAEREAAGRRLDTATAGYERTRGQLGRTLESHAP